MAKGQRALARLRRIERRGLALLLSGLGLYAALPTAADAAANPTEARPPSSLASSGPSIPERVQAVRDKLDKTDPSKQRSSALRRLAQYWVNFPNWPNWGNVWGNF